MLNGLQIACMSRYSLLLVLKGNIWARYVQQRDGPTHPFGSLDTVSGVMHVMYSKFQSALERS